MKKLRPSSWFPGDTVLGNYVDSVWTGLDSIFRDLDRWEIKGSIHEEARAFKVKVRQWLCLLVAGPDNAPPPQSAAPAHGPVCIQILTKHERQQQLTSMTTKALRKLAAGIVGGTLSSIPNRNLRIDEILNREYRAIQGGLSEDAEADNSGADLHNKSVKELQAMAQARNIKINRGSRKADIVRLLRSTEDPAAREKRQRTAIEDATPPTRGFNADIITPYFHVLAAHVWEQMIRLEALGKFIGHHVTHKHCSCSPCELANNRYNRTYFQSSEAGRPRE